jgi:hypothetical protein
MKSFDDLVADHKRSILDSEEAASEEARLIFLRLLYSALRKEIASPRLEISFLREEGVVSISHRAFDRELVFAAFAPGPDGDHLAFCRGRSHETLAADAAAARAKGRTPPGATLTDWALNSRRIQPGQLSLLGADRPLFREILDGVVREVAAAELNAID